MAKVHDLIKIRLLKSISKLSRFKKSVIIEFKVDNTRWAVGSGQWGAVSGRRHQDTDMFFRRDDVIFLHDVNNIQIECNDKIYFRRLLVRSLPPRNMLYDAKKNMIDI